MAFFQASEWHEGEKAIHKRAHVNFREDNPTSPFLTPMAAYQISRYPLMAIGTLDDDDRPWCTLWGSGEPPLSQPVAQSVIAIKTDVDATFDPVVQTIWKGKDDGEIVREEGEGRLISGLSIHLEERGRVKLAGRLIAGALSADQGSLEQSNKGKSGSIQLVAKIEQSLGNCPKYLNKKVITSSTPKPVLLSDSPHLPQEALDLIEKADMFFVASAHEHEDMDANHRGGPQGFIRIEQPENPDEASTLVWPEYSGNNLYQTLGNLEATPRAGLVIPDFETGDVLYLTGNTKILVGAEASQVIAKTNLAVSLKITAARLVQNGLPFRGTPVGDATNGRSPYNPRIRHLASEKRDPLGKTPGEDAPVTAQLLKKTKLTPTITRYRYALADPAVLGPWKPGQYVTMDFSKEMDMGYSHMRDDDPTSLNDDYLRTFTVSSVPNSLGVHGEEFEITLRKVGSVTKWLEWQREGMAEVGIRGFGGEFSFNQEHDNRIGFVAAGIGITPLLGQMGDLDVSRVHILWSLGIKDVGLALDLFTQYPSLKDSVTVFLTGDSALLGNNKNEKLKLQKLIDLGSHIERRRLERDDLTKVDASVDQWYLCTAPALRKIVQGWLPGKSIVYENFDY
jgi:NAD(P)H-flavin reductase